ncbi:MAG: heparan-alpha-glucosaminide N-acetyltransferase domain-containing protein [Candidatus Micrarchaeota archaeon]
MERVGEIDAFRGFVIVLMVFFTLTQMLSSNLPDILKHNQDWELHFGDFVLPMFLFASGMSLVFYVRKHNAKGRREFILDILERFGKLAIIALMLSVYTSGEIFGMDVIMLSALLFLGTMVVFRLSQPAILALMAAICLLYYALLQIGTMPVSMESDLGGYPAAAYYFTVMLSGMLFGKELERKNESGMKRLAIIFLALFAGSALLMPIDKMSASPSFMMLSVLISLGFFSATALAMKAGKLHLFQWLGRTPLRYWILMFLLFIIPLMYYTYFRGQAFPMEIDWHIGIAVSAGVMFMLGAVSWIIDRAHEKIATDMAQK